MTLTIVMWRYAPNFCAQDCNQDVKFVFMFAVHVPALGAGRTVSLVFSALMLATYSIVTFTECQAWLTNRNILSRGPEPPPEPPEERPPHMVEAAAVQRLRGGSGTRRSRLQDRYANRSKRIWLGFEADRALFACSLFTSHLWHTLAIIFGILIAQIIVFTYFIVTTELIVTQKGARVSGTCHLTLMLVPRLTSGMIDTNKWGFGQVGQRW